MGAPGLPEPPGSAPVTPPAALQCRDGAASPEKAALPARSAYCEADVAEGAEPGPRSAHSKADEAERAEPGPRPAHSKADVQAVCDAGTQAAILNEVEGLAMDLVYGVVLNAAEDRIAIDGDYISDQMESLASDGIRVWAALGRMGCSGGEISWVFDNDDRKIRVEWRQSSGSEEQAEEEEEELDEEEREEEEQEEG